jgi:hypothetical protein
MNEKKLQRFIASMKLIGLRQPATVHTTKKKNQVILVDGAYRLEAAKRLGWKNIPCFIMREYEEEHVNPWKHGANVYRVELTVLERAAHIHNLRVFVSNPLEGGKLPPAGGKLMGSKKAAKVLGFTRDEIRRAERIMRISSANQFNDLRCRFVRAYHLHGNHTEETAANFHEQARVMPRYKI